MAGRGYMAVPHEDGWAVKREGNQRNTSLHSNQKEAWAAACDWAKKHETTAVKHGVDGSVKETRSYEA